MISDSLREFDQILWKITFSHLQDSMMDFCMASTQSSVLDNGTVNRTACGSSLFRRSSARHLSLSIWTSVPTSRSTLPTCTPSALLRTGRDGTVLGSLPVVSPVLWLSLWSYCGSATMHASSAQCWLRKWIRVLRSLFLALFVLGVRTLFLRPLVSVSFVFEAGPA